ESARDRRCCVRGKVFERAPVNAFAETPDRSGPMSAVSLRAGPIAPPRISHYLVGVLAELAAGPTLPLDWIYPVLPGARGRNGQIEGDLNVGILGPDVHAALLPHRDKHRSKVMNAAFRLAERLVRFNVRRQGKGWRQVLQAGVREEGICLRAASFANRVLQQAVRQDDGWSGKVLATVVALDHEAAVVGNELEAERTDRGTGVAAAGRPARH